MIDISFEDTIETPEVIELYRANDWSSADRPDELINALRNSHFDSPSLSIVLPAELIPSSNQLQPLQQRSSGPV